MMSFTFLLSTDRTIWLRPIVTIMALYIAPVILLMAGVVPFKLRFHVLITMLVAAAFLAYSRDYSPTVLGLGLPSIRVLARWSLIPSALVLGGIFITSLRHRITPTQGLPFYIFFILVSAPAQEFLYRSFLFVELASVHMPRVWIIIVSSLLYSFLHVVYKDGPTLVLTFVIGLAWGSIFARTNSWSVVALSHALVGVLAIMLGVI